VVFEVVLAVAVDARVAEKEVVREVAEVAVAEAVVVAEVAVVPEVRQAVARTRARVAGLQ